MPAFRPNRIAAPEVLRQLSRANLLRLLEPFADHFKGIAMPPTNPADDEKLEYKFIYLADRLLETDPPPPQPLAKALFFAHHCATTDGEEAIEVALRERAKAAGLDDEEAHLPPRPCTPADLALHAWLLDPDILESIYPVLKMADPKSAQTYPAKVAKLAPPKLDRIPALEATLDTWYQKRKRRCAGTKVSHRVVNRTEHHFIVKRPDSFQRQGMMGKDGPAEFGFPERFDLVVIRTDSPEMVIVARPKGIREKYREAFADYLYGDPALFEGVDKYTLAPLAAPRAVDFEPIKGPSYTLAEIKLVLTRHTFGPKQAVTYEDPDIVAGLDRPKGAVRLPKRAPKRAKFALKFDGDVDKKGAHRPVYLELDPPHTCRYSRHCDTDAVDVWLEREKFIVERKPE